MRFLAASAAVLTLFCGAIRGADAPTPWEYRIELKVVPKNVPCVTCGKDCRCPPGACPGGCPVPAKSPGVVIVCSNGRCRPVTLDPTIIPPGFGPPPAGHVWYKGDNGIWSLYQIPKK